MRQGACCSSASQERKSRFFRVVLESLDQASLFFFSYLLPLRVVRGLRKKGFWVSGWDDSLRYGEPVRKTILCTLEKKYGQRVMEYKPRSSYITLPTTTAGVFSAPTPDPQETTSPADKAAAPTDKKPKPRRARKRDDPRPPRTDSIDLWHRRSDTSQKKSSNGYPIQRGGWSCSRRRNSSVPTAV